MTAPNIVIVESPAKAKTIEKYLGKDFHVLASYGHVRDLPPKDGSVRPDEGFAMDWELSERADKNVAAIAKAVKGADTVYLATDPDREGEAISWHVREILEEKKLLKGLNVKRVTFNEITKTAIKAAFSKPRELDENLVQAYLARRALDYLVGFNLSPVLWRKLPGSRSAGRVQSVALRLVCERESEIEAFRAQEYWSVTARLQTGDGATFTARLTHLSGNKLDKFDLNSEALAQAAIARIENKKLKVLSVEKKQVRRNPYPPFITSSLQMEASRKLGFSASQTMRLAQQLYEGVDIGGDTVGLITYMRTDGTNMADEAVMQARRVIGDRFGENFVPDAPRIYKSKAKNAQEAHEAIRPTDLSRAPDEVTRYLDERQLKLYDLIWKRSLACQMESAVLDQVSADISDGTDDIVLRASGSTVTFEGFLKVYEEDIDDKTDDADEDKNRRLPPLAADDALKTLGTDGEQHFTQPPPRFSEASLVKGLEERGIGRPSTYASILQVLQDRNYVRLDKRRFIPEDRGRLVTAFLVKFFEKYVDYNFTASLEDELDAISAGTVQWKDALGSFWKDFSTAVGATKDLTITEVLNHMDAELGPHFFPEEKDRVCTTCNTGRLSLKLGKFGAFIGCSRYPDCRFTKPLAVAGADDGEGGDANTGDAGPKILGNDPETGRTVSLRRGPYGPYVQIDPPEITSVLPAAEPEPEPEPEATEEAPAAGKGKGKAKTKAKAKPKKKKAVVEKPKRQGLPRGMKMEDVTLEAALKLLALPRTIGNHPETGEIIQAGIGRFGPYLKHQSTFTSIPKDDDVVTIGVNRAVVLMAEAAEKRANAPPRKGGRSFAGRKKVSGAKPKKTANE